MKSWLLEVSDLIRGNLNASYQGAKAVRSNQVIVFNNARNVNAKEKPTFCDAIEDELVESQYLSNYTILFVDCSQFDFAPRKNRGLLRRVQDNDELEVGQLNVTFAVSGGKFGCCFGDFLLCSTMRANIDTLLLFHLCRISIR
jgi:hypothetical protein